MTGSFSRFAQRRSTGLPHFDFGRHGRRCGAQSGRCTQRGASCMQHIARWRSARCRIVARRPHQRSVSQSCSDTSPPRRQERRQARTVRKCVLQVLVARAMAVLNGRRLAVEKPARVTSLAARRCVAWCPSFRKCGRLDWGSPGEVRARVDHLRDMREN